MRVLVRWFREDSGQDLVEWALLLALVVVGTTAFMNQSGTAVAGIWTNANLVISGQAGNGSGTPGLPVTNPVTPAPKGGHHHDDDGN